MVNHRCGTTTVRGVGQHGAARMPGRVGLGPRLDLNVPQARLGLALLVKPIVAAG
jgi:hypothetical protein